MEVMSSIVVISFPSNNATVINAVRNKHAECIPSIEMQMLSNTLKQETKSMLIKDGSSAGLKAADQGGHQLGQ
jgi:hypothetical protein